METIYYSVDARRLSMRAAARECWVSGGEESVCYAFVPVRPRQSEGVSGDNVVDFAAYRRQMESCAPEETPEEVSPAPRARRGTRRWLLLDLCASGAVLAASVVILLRFLAL